MPRLSIFNRATSDAKPATFQVGEIKHSLNPFEASPASSPSGPSLEVSLWGLGLWFWGPGLTQTTEPIGCLPCSVVGTH